MNFQWNKAKAALNLDKHGVSFEEASTVFDDPLSNIVSDPDHSIDEYRWVTTGTSDQGRLLVVAFTERGDITRIISARETISREARNYATYLPDY
ncbi:MAG: BrnT family toxin [Acidobacteriota bacterium]|nr:BrnT family toxin [Acidobacteriota bacterium]